MPVLIYPSFPEHHLFARGENKAAKERTGKSANLDCINIGLINNMPDFSTGPYRAAVV